MTRKFINTTTLSHRFINSPFIKTKNKLYKIQLIIKKFWSLIPSNSSLKSLRDLLVPVRHLLELVRHVEQTCFSKIAADEL